MRGKPILRKIPVDGAELYSRIHKSGFTILSISKHVLVDRHVSTIYKYLNADEMPVYLYNSIIQVLNGAFYEWAQDDNGIWIEVKKSSNSVVRRHTIRVDPKIIREKYSHGIIEKRRVVK